MPQIERITECKRGGRLLVRLSDGRLMRLEPEILYKRDLHIGDTLDNELLEALGCDEESARARNAVARMAAYAVFSTDARRKLIEKGFSPENTELAIEWLESIGGINDAETAVRYARTKLYAGKGPGMITYELRRKSLPREIIEAAVEALPDCMDVIYHFYEKEGCEEPKDYYSLRGKLYKRGFSGEDIARAERAYKENKEKRVNEREN